MPSSMRLTTTVSGARVVMREVTRRSRAPNAKAIGTPASTPAATSSDEEDDELVVAERGEHRLEQPQRRRRSPRSRSSAQRRSAPSPPVAQQAQQRERPASARSRPAAPRARQMFGISSAGVTIAASSAAYSMAGCRIRTRNATATRDARTPRRSARQRGDARADQRRHAHVLAAAERDHGAEHREPEEQDGGELVRPDERLVEDVARDHAGEQDQRPRARSAARPAPRRSRPSQPSMPRRSAMRAGRPARPPPVCAISMARRQRLRRSCRCTSPAPPRPRRRTCPSTPCRSRRLRSLARNGVWIDRDELHALARSGPP